MTGVLEPTVAPASSGGLAGAPPKEQSRARYPDQTGFVARDGVRVWWEAYGSGERTVMLLPTWSIVHSRFWKGQIPYLARHFRVLTFDGRGNGRSDRPVGGAAYATDEFAADAIAVMDATDTASAVMVSLSCGALWATILAAEHPERVDGAVYVGPAVALAPNHPERDGSPFEDALENHDGWAKYNRHYWSERYLEFLEFFFAKCFSEPHSTKQIEDCVGWGLETNPLTLADATRGAGMPRAERFRDTCSRVRCRTLVLHGDRDEVRPLAQGEALARASPAASWSRSMAPAIFRLREIR